MYTKCVWCNQHLTAQDNPKLLECLHAACNSCVLGKISESQCLIAPHLLTCSICKIRSKSTNIIDNQFILESLANNHDETQTNATLDIESKVKIIDILNRFIFEALILFLFKIRYCVASFLANKMQ